jgi:predicted DNA-binding protein (MmcQ/YjbR family)
MNAGVTQTGDRADARCRELDGRAVLGGVGVVERSSDDAAVTPWQLARYDECSLRLRWDAVSISKGSAMSTRKRSVRARATADDLRRVALALPEAVETITWGEPHFRVQNKIFTGLGAREGRMVSSVKLEKSHAEVRLFDPRFRPAPYVGRFGWVEFALEDVTVGELEELVAESHRLVAKVKPRRARPRIAAARRRGS